MRRTLTNRLLLAGLTAASLAAAPGALRAQPAAAPSADARVDKNTGAILVPLGSVARYDTKADKLPVDLFIRDDAVAAVRLDLQNPKVLVITGKQAGVTEVTVTFEDRTRKNFTVLVQPDLDLLRKTLKQTVPTANVEVQPGVGGTIILSGYVNQPNDGDLVARIASSAVGGNVNNVINAIQVGGAQHVQIDVTVAQVDRTELRERGFAFGVNGTTFGISSILPGLATQVATGVGGIGTIIPSAQANIQFGIVPAGTLGALRALKTEGVARLLSEPKLVVQSGHPAYLKAGGQQAVISPQASLGGVGVELRDVGTTLEVLPIVFGNGKIFLELTPEFVTVNVGRGITTANGFSPGFNRTSARSSVYLEPGQTYAIGGLLETESQTTLQKIPYLGDLPFVGAAFSNIVASERETELIILVTPHLVDALDCTQVPRRLPGKESRAPDDYELFLESIIEAPRGQRQVFVNGKYVPAFRNSQTAKDYPCVGGLNGTCATGALPQFTSGTPVTPVFGQNAAPVLPPAPAGTPTTIPPAAPAGTPATLPPATEAPIVAIPPAPPQ